MLSTARLLALLLRLDLARGRLLPLRSAIPLLAIHACPLDAQEHPTAPSGNSGHTTPPHAGAVIEPGSHTPSALPGHEHAFPPIPGGGHPEGKISPNQPLNPREAGKTLAPHVEPHEHATTEPRTVPHDSTHAGEMSRPSTTHAVDSGQQFKDSMAAAQRRADGTAAVLRPRSARAGLRRRRHIGDQKDPQRQRGTIIRCLAEGSRQRRLLRGTLGLLRQRSQLGGAQFQSQDRSAGGSTLRH